MRDGVAEIAAKVAAGDARALARAATAIENHTPEAAALLRELAPHAGRAIVLGITGPPGAGSSTRANPLVPPIPGQEKTSASLPVNHPRRARAAPFLPYPFPLLPHPP